MPDILAGANTIFDNLNTSSVLGWISNTANALNSISNQNSIDAAQTLTLLAENKAISLAYYAQSTLASNNIDTDIKKQNTKATNDAASINTASQQELSSIDDYIGKGPIDQNPDNEGSLGFFTSAQTAILTQSAAILPLTEQIESNRNYGFGTLDGLKQLAIDNYNASLTSPQSQNTGVNNSSPNTAPAVNGMVDANSVNFTNADITTSITDYLINGQPAQGGGYIAWDPRKKAYNTIYRGFVKVNSDQSISQDPSTLITPASYNTVVNNALQSSDKAEYWGSYKFFIEQLHGRYSNGKPYRKNPVTALKNNNSIPEEYTNRMVFSAYINNYNDNYNVEWSKYNFLGRGEPFPIYKQTNRTFTLEFLIMADYSVNLLAAFDQLKNLPADQDKQLEVLLSDNVDWGLGQYKMPKYNNTERLGGHIPGMYTDSTDTLWKKVSFLSQCCYPYYREDGKMKEQPFIRLRVSDFYDVIATITSLSFDLNVFDDGVMIDLNPNASTFVGNIPMAIKCTMACDIYHDYEPSSTFWGFYHRREYDTAGYDAPITGSVLYDKSLDDLKKSMQKKGGNKTTTAVSYDNESMQATPTSITPAQNQIIVANNSFQSVFSNFQSASTGINVQTTQLQQQLEQTAKAYKILQDTVAAAKEQYNLTDSSAATSSTSSNTVTGQNTGNTTTGGDNYTAQTNAMVSSGVQTGKNSVNSNANNINNNLNSSQDSINNNNSINQARAKSTSSVPKTIGDLVNRNSNQDVG